MDVLTYLLEAALVTALAAHLGLPPWAGRATVEALLDGPPAGRGRVVSVTFSGLVRRGESWRDADFVGEDDEDASLNLSNANARALAALLGLPGHDEDCVAGSVTVPEARRAVMLARATFERRAPALTWTTEEVRGPRHHEDGTVELHALRAHLGGLSVDGLHDRLERFAATVERVAALGATHLTYG